MLNLILFGPPGSGKGTQSVKLAKKYNLIHLSTGDMLRSQIAKGTTLGLEAKAIMERGELVSDRIVIGMIEQQIEENPGANGFIFDGFPRTTVQAMALDDLLEKHDTKISATLSLEVNKTELVKRLLERGKLSGRPDDRNEEVIENRISEYLTKTSPLIEYYKNEGKYKPVWGMGEIDEVFSLLCHEIDHLDAGDVHGEGILEAQHGHRHENHESINKKHHKNQNLMLNEELFNDQDDHGNQPGDNHDETHAETEEQETKEEQEEREMAEKAEEMKAEEEKAEEKPAPKKKAAPAKKPAAKKKAAKKPAAKKKAAKKPAAKKKAAKKPAAKKKAAKKPAKKKAAKKPAAKKKAAKKPAAKKKVAKKPAAKKSSKKAKGKKRR